MVNAAGLAVLAIALTGVVPSGARASWRRSAAAPDQILPDGWELVVFAVGCGLVAYGAVDRAPGPAYLGVANLVAFVVSAGVQRRRDAATSGRC